MSLKSVTDATAGALLAKRSQRERRRRGASAAADPTARAVLRRADPVLRELMSELEKAT